MCWAMLYWAVKGVDLLLSSGKTYNVDLFAYDWEHHSPGHWLWLGQFPLGDVGADGLQGSYWCLSPSSCANLGGQRCVLQKRKPAWSDPIAMLLSCGNRNRSHLPKRLNSYCAPMSAHVNGSAACLHMCVHYSVETGSSACSAHSQSELQVMPITGEQD